MCFNCGCGMPEDEMGKGHVHDGGGSITEETFKKIAKDWDMSPDEAKKNVLEELKKQLEEES